MNIMNNLFYLKDTMRASFAQTFKEIKPMPGSPQINRFLALVNDDEKNLVISGSGFSINRNAAQNSAIGESIERYCANYYNADNIIFEKYSDLERLNIKTLNPSIITRYTSEQYKKYLEYKDFNKDEPITWSNAKSILNDEDIFIPFELIYLCNPPFNLPLRDIISTGLACGQSKEQAIISGFNECIERDSFMHFWLLGLVNYEIDLSSIDDFEIKEMLEISNNCNLKLRAYDITTDLKVPTILTVVQVKNQNGFYLGCASSLDSFIALKKSIEEGIGGFSIYFEVIHYYKEEVPNMLDSSSTLDQHPLYYLAGNNDVILEELLPETLPKKKFRNYSLNFKETINNLFNEGYEIYYKDITTIDVKEMNLSVVRVSIPNLGFLSINDPLLNCPRIIEKATKLKKNINLEPHPFP